MKIKYLLAGLVLSLILVAWADFSSPAAMEKTGRQPDQLIAYYLHGNIRCASCLQIEKYSREVIETFFQPELDSGKLVFEVINVQEPENEHFLKDYQLYSWSLVISLRRNKKEVKYLNLTKVWDYLHDRPKFFSYVHEEINRMLSELQPE